MPGRRHTASRRGFSLTELSVVLLIIALVSGMTLSAGKTQLDIAAFKGSQRNIEILRDTLNLFQKKSKRYPCPAVPTESPADANYGLEAAGCDAACPAGLVCDGTAVIGFVPFKTLGIGEKLAYDDWDHKITYAIDKSHTATSEYNNGSLPVVDAGGNKITQSPLFGDAIFVLVSHGEEGSGAYDKQGVQTTACGATALDKENCNDDQTFMDTAFNNGTDATTFFDDLVLWQTQENVDIAALATTDDDAEDEFEYVLGAGWNHNCFTKLDGTSWCWGQNDRGQLGDNTTTNQSTPVQVAGLTGAIDYGLGNLHSCALKSDGTVWCWGAASRCGDGTATERHTPVQVSGLTGITQISGMENHTCALKNDNTVWCWGENTAGANGQGVTTGYALTPVQVAGLTGVLSVTTGMDYSCGAKADGTVWCWGINGYGQLGNGTTTDSTTPVQVSGLTGVTQVEAIETHTCALKNDGTTWCWGDNTNGRLGDGTTTQRTSPVQVSGLTGVTFLQGYQHHTCALKSDGSVRCWGKGWCGRMGTGNQADANTPVQPIGYTGINVLGTGGATTCALKSDGTLWCGGCNSNSAVGDGTTTDQWTPVQVLNLP